MNSSQVRLSLIAVVAVASPGFGAAIIADSAWSSASTWSGGVPNAIGAIAENSTGDAARTTTLDLNATVGVIRSTIRRSFTINSNGTNVLTMDNGLAADAQITGSTSGSFSATVTINPNISLADTLLVTQNSGSGDKRVDVNGNIGGTGNINVVNNEGLGGGVRLDGVVNSVGFLTWGGTNSDTTWSNITGSIGGNVTGLTKNGTGWLTLAGTANAWSGATVVNAGQLRIASSSSLGDPAPLTIATGATLNLLGNQISQGTVTALTLGSTVYTATGTYGATGSGADFVNDTYFSGTGVVTLVPEPTTFGTVAALGGLALCRRRAARC